MQVGFSVGASLQTGFSVGHVVGASLQTGFSVGHVVGASLQNGFSVGIVEQFMQTGLLGECDEERGPERRVGGFSDALFVG